MKYKSDTKFYSQFIKKYPDISYDGKFIDLSSSLFLTVTHLESLNDQSRLKLLGLEHFLEDFNNVIELNIIREKKLRRLLNER